ncbi:chemotaxis protein CheA [Phenylobacterium sp.]|jgi:two-component system chemotaxis sensor kinase CheA|uniref:chemotaxis protein CheA n=1 Tax=Phenylobacterium sp. TaxID=1871053 RepID=UPI0037C59303
MDELEEIKLTFFQECDELMGDLEAGLLNIQGGNTDPELVNAVFRAVHSVKGGAGAFGLEALVRYAHVFETLLDNVRSGKTDLTPELLKVLLRAADVLADHVVAAKVGGEGDPVTTAAMVEELESWISGVAATAEPSASVPVPAPSPVAAQPNDDGIVFKPIMLSISEMDESPSQGVWAITFQPMDDLYSKANEAGLLIREIERLGAIEVELLDDALPLFDHLEPESAHIAWKVRLTTAASEAQIREVFEFVEGDCAITIVREAAPQAPAAPGGGPDIAAIIAAAQAANVEPEPAFTPLKVEIPEVAPAPAPVSVASAPVAELPVARKSTAAQAAPAAAEKANQATIRVDPERIDKLIDLVGELVINQAMLAQRVAGHGFAASSDVGRGLDELEQLTRDIQDSVMAIRAQSVRSVFQRMPRLVREVASQTGKQVRLVTEGENTEVDKTVIERISEPITHMLRNAIDHGLESPEERAAANKPAEGVVRLAALHRGGRIVIEVADDGKGINRPRVRQIAIDRGLISADAQLTDEEVDNLIFLPGFSTANAVSDISGRGVGMDVVRKSVQGLGGRISISSRPGQGSTFTLSLPLTLAVLDGMVIDVAGQTLVVPLTAIVESLRPSATDVKKLGPQGSVLAVRDTYVPLVDIGRVLSFQTTEVNPAAGVVLLVESEDGSRAALVADSIHGQRQVVIKSLESNYQQVPGIAAATILGDGRVALILDVDALVAMRKRETLRAPEPTIQAAE